MRHLESEALAAFMAVAESTSFTNAAQRLNKSQAAVSIAIGRLEERIGRKLFDRSNRRVVLTDAGERLRHFAQKILSLEDEAIAELTELGDEARIRFGMPDDYLDLFGAALIKDVSTRFPHVRIDLRCGFSRELETLVEARELDIAIITQDAANPKGEIVRKERQIWCAAPMTQPETKPVLRLALFPDGCRARPHILNALDQAGRRWSIGYSSSSIHGIELAIASGDMVTVLPESAVPAHWRRLGEEDGLPPIPSLSLAIYTFQQSRIAVRQLMTFVRGAFA